MDISLVGLIDPYMPEISDHVKYMLQSLIDMSKHGVTTEKDYTAIAACARNIKIEITTTIGGFEVKAYIDEDNFSKEFIEENRGQIDLQNINLEKAITPCFTSVFYDYMEIPEIYEGIVEQAKPQIEEQFVSALGGTT